MTVQTLFWMCEDGDDTCEKKTFGHSSFVCTCTATACHTFPEIPPMPENTVTVISSDKQSDRFAVSNVQMAHNSSPYNRGESTFFRAIFLHNNKLWRVISMGVSQLVSTGGDKYNHTKQQKIMQMLVIKIFSHFMEDVSLPPGHFVPQFDHLICTAIHSNPYAWISIRNS